jgi:hypothetical protein
MNWRLVSIPDFFLLNITPFYYQSHDRTSIPSQEKTSLKENQIKALQEKLAAAEKKLQVINKDILFKKMLHAIRYKNHLCFCKI